MEERLIYLGGSSINGNGPGPSSTVLQIGGRALMVDCGIEILKGGGYGLPDFSILSSRGIKISALALTHGHLDHVGSVGIASEKGVFKNGAPIYGSPQTNAWLPSVLTETWARGVGRDFYMSVNKTANMLKPIPYGEFEIMPGVPAFAKEAGHVPGALYLLVRLPSGKIVLFCGDNSWHDQETVAGTKLPDDIPDNWLPDIIAVTDLTNPALTKFDYDLQMGRLAKRVSESLEKKRIVVIAAFAYGREQNVALGLAKAFRQAQGETGIRPVYADGSGVNIFKIFQNNRWSPGDREFSLDGIELIGESGVKKGRQRNELLASEEPFVVVTPAGFGDGGPIRFWMEQGIENPNFEFIATSWLLPDCTMDQLLRKFEIRKIAEKRGETKPIPLIKLEDEDGNKKKLKVKCHVSHFHLSAHGGLGDTSEMVKKIVARRGRNLEAIVLTHGSQESKQAAAHALGQFAETTISASAGTILKL